MTAIYRIVELTSGSIWIDGVDISTIGLNTLRSGLAIIPQDPVSPISIETLRCPTTDDFFRPAASL